MKILAIAVPASLVALAGCFAFTPLHPEVDIAHGVSLKDYHAVLVGPVTDRSGYPFGYDMGDTLRNALIGALRSHGVPVRSLEVKPAPGDTALGVGAVLLVSSLNRFQSGAVALGLPTTLGPSRCVFSTRLADGRTGKRLGDIVTAELVDPADVIGTALSPRQVLESCVDQTATALKQRLG